MSEKKSSAKKAATSNAYQQIVERIFTDRYEAGKKELPFRREDLTLAAQTLGVAEPKNLGDVVYAIRSRIDMPATVTATQPEGLEWIIEGAGRAKYKFRLAKLSRVVPSPDRVVIRIPDNTPEIIAAYKLDDEQALLAKVRYNRLIDIFLGLTTYSLQNHLRTTVRGVGQIEIDELYVGLDRFGCHYVIPVQAKGGNDEITRVQTEQDIKWCAQKYPRLRCRAIAAQFMANDRIALFELKIDDDDLKVAEERHYQLVPATNLIPDAIVDYRPLEG